MCTVLAWNGQLPKGLLTKLIIAAEVRGRDSAGIAWRDEEAQKIRVLKQQVSPRKFTERCQSSIGDARRTAIGLAHTRRASPGMPIDSTNAHPFVYKGVVFAHNGKVDNWKELRDNGLLNKFTDAQLGDGDAQTLQGIKDARTDSQLLGPLIKARDFSPIIGCAGLVWLHKSNAYCFRTQKELTSVVIRWPEDGVVQVVCIVCSTFDIVNEAVSKTSMPVGYLMTEQPPLDENTVYRIEQSGCVSEGVAPVNPQNHADWFTSGAGDDLTVPGA